MISLIQNFISGLTYDISLSHPIELGVLFLLGVMSDIGVPLFFSVEIFLLFASYYVGPLSFQVLLIIAMLLSGREIGAAILYWVSRIIGEPFLEWLKRHHIPWIAKGMDRIKSIMVRRPTLVVALVRLTPGFLQVPSVVSGTLRLKYPQFAVGVALSALIYDFSLVFFGFIARTLSQNVMQNLVDYFLIGFIVFIGVVWTVIYFRFRHSFGGKNLKS